eukprot:1183821-Prymnesium_polylepis.1
MHAGGASRGSRGTPAEQSAEEGGADGTFWCDFATHGVPVGWHDTRRLYRQHIVRDMLMWRDRNRMY